MVKSDFFITMAKELCGPKTIRIENTGSGQPPGSFGYESVSEVLLRSGM